MHLLFIDGRMIADVCGYLSRVTGFIVIPGEGINAEQVLAVAKSKNAPVLVQSDLSPESLKPALARFVNGMVPKDLTRVLTAAADSIFKTFFKDIGKFAEAEPVVKGFERQINFSMVGGNLIGYFVTRFRVAALAPVQEGNKGPVELVVQEPSNQILGLIGQALGKVNVSTKVGLPTVFDLTKIPEIRALSYFPSVHVTDAQKKVFLSLGFLNLEGEPLFDLSGVDSAATSSDVEFL
jgi:hypothetical protein